MANETETAPEPTTSGMRRKVVLAVAGVLVCAVPLWIFWARKHSKRPIDYNTLLGCETIPQVPESGFWGTEWDELGRPFRWTNGGAKLVVPIDSEKPPHSIRFEIRSNKEVGSLLQLHVNGTKIFDKQVEAGVTKEVVSLKDVKIGKELVIEILSDSFVPEVQIKGSTDNRTLGVMVKGIRLLRQPG
jgi:hypothetical protein